MRHKRATLMALALVLCTTGIGQASPVIPNAIDEVREDLPLLSPDLIWVEQLPGSRRPEPRDPNASIANEVSEAIRVLSAGWPVTGNQTDWAGTPGLVTHLSPPGEAPRAIFWFADGHLYLVEKTPTDWQTRRLTDSYADTTAVIDLSGDGQPEIIAAAQYGSGAVLALQVLAWDRQRVWTAFTHTGAREPGQFGWCDTDGDAQRELWIDTAAGRGFFVEGTHGPFLRDRLLFRWDNGTLRQVGRYRFTTPYYHLNRYLYFASREDWASAARHVEPGAQIDQRLATGLGTGPFRGGSDTPFVNGRIYFAKGSQNYFADFGGTGRLVRINQGEPPPGH